MPRWSRRVHQAPPLRSVTPVLAPPAPRADWKAVSPLKRVLDGKPPVPSTEFESKLTTRQDPRFLAPLGPLVMPEAPRGEGDVPIAAPGTVVRTWERHSRHGVSAAPPPAVASPLRS